MEVIRDLMQHAELDQSQIADKVDSALSDAERKHYEISGDQLVALGPWLEHILSALGTLWLVSATATQPPAAARRKRSAEGVPAEETKSSTKRAKSQKPFDGVTYRRSKRLSPNLAPAGAPLGVEISPPRSKIVKAFNMIYCWIFFWLDTATFFAFSCDSHCLSSVHPSQKLLIQQAT